jgi:hypothetical protein
MQPYSEKLYAWLEPGKTPMTKSHGQVEILFKISMLKKMGK